MDRRELLHALSATAALAFIPRTAAGASAFVANLHARVAQPGPFRTLTPAQQEVVSRVCDLIIPRTDTPGALDVKVPELIDLLLTEWYDDADRSAFLSNLKQMSRVETAQGTRALHEASQAEVLRVMEALDARRTEAVGPGAAFRELKSLTVFGYFTSEAVTRDVLETRMVFSRYQGDAEVTS